MTNSPCYLRISLPLESEATIPDDGKWIWSLTPEEIADSLEKVYDLGGCQDRFSVESIRESKDGGFVGLTAREAIIKHLQRFKEDMKEMQMSPDGRSLEIEFDPSKWFADGDDQFYNFASGRLYWLATSGALQHFGWQVEGTGF